MRRRLGRLRRYLRPMVRAGDVLDALRNLPLTDCRTLLRECPVLVLSPHPDDESLGCGGLFAACHEHGLPAYAAFVTDGAASHLHSREYPPARLAASRETEARSALLTLDLAEDRIEFLRLREATTSKLASANGNASASASWNVMLRPLAAARALPRASRDGT